MDAPLLDGYTPPEFPTSYCITDLKGVYAQADEYVAEMAGLDSPSALLGKTDADLIWQGNDGNERRRMTDGLVKLHGQHTMNNWSYTSQGWRLYTMHQSIQRESGKVYFHFHSVDSTATAGQKTLRWVDRIRYDEGILALGPEFGGAQLSRTDLLIARARLLNYKHKDIVKDLAAHGISKATLRKSITHWNTLRQYADDRYLADHPDHPGIYNAMAETGLLSFLLQQEDWFLGSPSY